MAKVTGKDELLVGGFLEWLLIIFCVLIILLGGAAFIISVQNKIDISELKILTRRHSVQINYKEKMQERYLLSYKYGKNECDWCYYKYINGVWVLIGCSKDPVVECKQPKHINIGRDPYIVWEGRAWRDWGSYNEDKKNDEQMR